MKYGRFPIDSELFPWAVSPGTLTLIVTVILRRMKSLGLYRYVVIIGSELRIFSFKAKAVAMSDLAQVL